MKLFTRTFSKIFKSSNQQELDNTKNLISAINSKEGTIRSLSEGEIKERSLNLKRSIKKGNTLENLIPESFALVREAAKRTLGERHYDVQLAGGIILHQGKIAEMKTGEGKTLVSTLPAFLNSLTDKGVHIVTVNDYLAKRDSEWMGKVFNYLGTSIGCITNDLNDLQRKQNYKCDITYATNNELGFDYLRDNMKYELTDMVQREHNFCIVDEVDSILIDESRTPLIISGRLEDKTNLYSISNEFMKNLQKKDFELDEKNKNAILTDQGIDKIEKLSIQKKLLKNNNFYDPENFNKRELDVLLSSGEQITSALLAGALINLGINSKSWLNWQIPILTDGDHSNARIINMNVTNINKFLSEKGVAIIPGFQGISKTGEVTTIGRGGSDATAVAVAKIFKADSCEIYTDVDGVFSTDPNKIPVAKKIEKISYDEMLELSSLGAKVMQSSAVQTAMIYNIPLEVKSTFTDRTGTKIFNQENIDYSKSVTGVAYSKDDAKVTLISVEDKPGVAANIFEPLSKNQINVDMVIQNISSDQKTTDITFTVKREDLTKTLEILKNNQNIVYKNIGHNDKVSKVSIVGAGMVSTPGVTYKMFRALAEEKINILAISTSEIKLSVIINEDDTLRAIKKLHTIFDLD